MFTLRRWWERNGVQIAVATASLGAAWFLQQQQGAPLLEAYHWLTRPFQGNPAQQSRLEGARVAELEQRITELESQNQRLKEVVKYVQASKKPGVAATVVGRSADNWWQQITINRGSRHGIRVNHVVTGPGGLVGRVQSVTEDTSRVLLVSDPTSQVGVMLSRSRHMGYIRGLGSNQAVVQFFDKVPNVKPNDVVVTSPISRLFPVGIPVGRVKSVNINKSPAPEAIVELSAPLNYLEWVVVEPGDQP